MHMYILHICIHVYHVFFYLLSFHGHLGCVHVLAIVSSAAVNIGVHLYLLIRLFSKCMSRIGIAGSCDKSVFSFFEEPAYCFPQWLHQFTLPPIYLDYFWSHWYPEQTVRGYRTSPQGAKARVAGTQGSCGVELSSPARRNRHWRLQGLIKDSAGGLGLPCLGRAPELHPSSAALLLHMPVLQCLQSPVQGTGTASTEGPAEGGGHWGSACCLPAFSPAAPPTAWQHRSTWTSSGGRARLSSVPEAPPR